MPLFSFDRSVLDQYPAQAHSLLETLVFTQAGVLKAAQVSELTAALSVDEEALPERLLAIAAACAVVPVSNFYVGVVIKGGSGNYYLGANMEFDGGFLGLSIHGEQSAINNAWLHGEKSIESLTVNAAPCGHCRQFLHELNTSDKLQVNITPPEGKKHSGSLQHFLPEAFGPADLGVDGGLLTGKPIDLHIETDDELVRMAADAACHSYAPYSGGYAGVALETADGLRVVGRYAENAAYNPSLQPLASALSQLRFQCLGKKVELKRMVMVEKHSHVHHASHVSALREQFPHVEMELIQVA
ncbi:cytidine deaminase [Parendozoicomonas haliclonae]|uniref:Cytidine deaminase n=1 Tax=Parendozoicomonas haliclonae TaxID=1960125 RepID=A0A1X7AJL1_9GAMM|nr:cytidine deaminase [Parendozoicomonas haliclonae]SMA46746.1 Cytidine deaminase [Parendozoicomonas haliclonae]